MKNAAQAGRRILADASGDGEKRVGYVERISRIAELVGDDSDLVFRLVEPEHRAGEIRPERAVDPGRA